jgi:GntR family transcriptional repressor for pyruvate dehydrogenase complex
LGAPRAPARSTGNHVLAEVVDSLLTAHSAEQQEILKIFDARRRDHDEHLAILAAIDQGDATAASERMRAHLADVEAVVLRRLDNP